jgi:GH24 family phage-related lysozyme (muramidase)
MTRARCTNTFIHTLLLIVSSIAANTLTYESQITLPPAPLRVLGQLVQYSNNLNTQIEQYPSLCNTNPYYIYNINTVKPKNHCQPTATGTPLSEMHASSRLVEFIIGYEGNAGMLPASKRLTGDTYGMYNDFGGNCTVGIGHLVHFGMCTANEITLYKITFPNGQTEVQALQRLYEDIIGVEDAVKDVVKVHLTQQQFDALVDFTFVEGINKLEESKLLEDINAGNFDATTIRNDLLEITRDGVLVARRNDEANIFNNGIYGE